MSTYNIPDQDALYQQWITNFATVAAANATELGLSTGDTTAMTTQSAGFTTAYNNSQTTKNTLKSRIASKNNKRTSSEALFRTYAKQINANSSISDELKAQLGITITPSVVGPVVPPIDLVVTGYETGVNKLAWKRNGNAQGTAFIIESKPETSGVWTIINVCTATKFDHTGQVPGQRVSYRISAKRGNSQSVPCAPVSVYDDAVPPVLTLHEAA